MSRSLHDLTFDELEALVTGWGEPKFRAQQIWEWLYRQAAGSIDDMGNLPASLRERLAESHAASGLSVDVDLLSEDGWTRKVLFRLPDGKAIETVLMGYDERRTVCVSSQAGCAMGCPFCATGQGGLERNLTAGEIVEQVLFFERALRHAHAGDGKDQPAHHVTNLVLMGMGEPFANYGECMKAMRRLNDPRGWNFGARRMTVSTVGLVPAIDKFTRDGGQINLAVSIHAATDELRNELVPLNRRYPLDELVAACRRYVDATNRRLSFEWALIDGVNDMVEQAEALGRLARRLPRKLIHVNLIPLNDTGGYAGTASRRERIDAFRTALDGHGIANTLRVRRGIDIHAGCGQLRHAEKGHRATLTVRSE